MNTVIKASGPLRGELMVGPDKSISHRAVIFSALARGQSVVKNFLNAADTWSTCACIRQLGIDISSEATTLIINGQGLTGLKEASETLDCGNSGTTMRLMAGVLAGQSFSSRLSGDDSLNGRPMRRVIEPLTMMGADISSRDERGFAPLTITGTRLRSIEYQLPVASAQVKSAIILAALNAKGDTAIIEPKKSRDHTERMLASMGANLHLEQSRIIIKPGRELNPQEFMVPGDISSAAFFLVAACIVPGSELQIKDVGVNPTRAGILEVLRSMGARIIAENQRLIGGEPVADLIVFASALKGVIVEGEIIPRLIDEIPVLAVAMAAAEGESIVRDAGELRVKETDRITAICSQLGRMGVDIQELADGFKIKGAKDALTGSLVDSRGDHRIAMSLAVAALLASGETVISNSEAVNISFPTFWEMLAKARS